MHDITITFDKTYSLNTVSCSCGYIAYTSLGSDLDRLANTHARDNRPSIIRKPEEIDVVELHRRQKGRY